MTQRRGERNVFLTGATGFIGSHLLVELIRAGHRVTALARTAPETSARQRVDKLLDWFGLEATYRERLRVVEGSLDGVRLGLHPAEYERALQETGDIVHCASSTFFSAGRAAEVRRTNVDGLKNLLCFAVESRCRFFHLVSTAYVAGKAQGACEEAFEPEGDFNNVYEETKHEAERLCLDILGARGIVLNILRPSIVYGDSRTGRSLRFNAVYHPVKSVLKLRDLFVQDIREKGGRQADAMGVRLMDDGALYLPLRIEASAEGGINLIPIDYLSRAFMAVFEDAGEGGVFHLVNERLKTIAQLIDYTGRLFRIEGMRAVAPGAFGASPASGVELLFQRYIQVYAPYMLDRKTFADGRTRAILKGRGIACPDFDFATFTRCMHYAVSCDFGAAWRS